MQVSPAGEAFIKREEALRLRAYDDGVGCQTIGWGHVIKPEDGIDCNKSISKEKAQEILNKDLREVDRALSRLIKVPVNQNQYDALASFVFNLGEDKVRDSTLFRKLNNGEYAAVDDQLNRWVYAGGKIMDGPDGKSGLVGRRRREGQLFNGQPIN